MPEPPFKIVGTAVDELKAILEGQVRVNTITEKMLKDLHEVATHLTDIVKEHEERIKRLERIIDGSAN